MDILLDFFSSVFQVMHKQFKWLKQTIHHFDYSLNFENNLSKKLLKIKKKCQKQLSDQYSAI